MTTIVGDDVWRLEQNFSALLSTKASAEQIESCNAGFRHCNDLIKCEVGPRPCNWEHRLPRGGGVEAGLNFLVAVQEH